MEVSKMSIQSAIQTIIDEHQISNYRLAKVLGLKQQIMIKRYLDGDVRSVTARIAFNIYKHYGILVDTFNNVEELKACYDEAI